MAEVFTDFPNNLAPRGCASRLDRYLPTHPNPRRRRFVKVSLLFLHLKEAEVQAKEPRPTIEQEENDQP